MYFRSTSRLPVLIYYPVLASVPHINVSCLYKCSSKGELVQHTVIYIQDVPLLAFIRLKYHCYLYLSISFPRG